MNIRRFRRLICWGLALGGFVSLEAKDPLTVADLHGGLVVQIGSPDSNLAARLSGTGRYLIHLLDSDPSVTTKPRWL